VGAQIRELGIDTLRAPDQETWPPPAGWFEEVLSAALERSPDPLALYEIGGYFAPVVNSCAERWPGRLLGVVEDTEAGHRRYLDAEPLAIAAYSVARSPLKRPEDVLVGESIAFSVEGLLRRLDRPLRGVSATVLGYGSVGSATAGSLASRGARVTVWDPDPGQRIAALASGFLTPAREDAIRAAELLIGTSGEVSVGADDLSLLRPGCILASGSSRRTEFELGSIERRTVLERAGGIPSLEALSLPPGGEAYLAYAGFPVNFGDAASIGAFLQLSQAEGLAAICRLADGVSPPGLQEAPEEVRLEIARLWLDSHVDGKSGEMRVAPPGIVLPAS